MKTAKPESAPLFLTPEQAAKISGLGVNRIRQLMDAKEVAYLPVGKRRLTRIQDLLDYYERAKVYANQV
nr:helix-turn-helix domain-containing protein [uncultured Oscillibacter sp.]